MYNDRAGDVQLAEFKRSARNHNRAVRGSERTLLTIKKFSAMHNGGMLQFGRDGHLYVGVGDGGESDTFAAGQFAQDLGSLFGKILRLDPAPVRRPSGAARYDASRRRGASHERRLVRHVPPGRGPLESTRARCRARSRRRGSGRRNLRSLRPTHRRSTFSFSSPGRQRPRGSVSTVRQNISRYSRCSQSVTADMKRSSSACLMVAR